MLYVPFACQLTMLTNEWRTFGMAHPGDVSPTDGSRNLLAPRGGTSWGSHCAVFTWTCWTISSMVASGRTPWATPTWIDRPVLGARNVFCGWWVIGLNQLKLIYSLCYIMLWSVIGRWWSSVVFFSWVPLILCYFGWWSSVGFFISPKSNELQNHPCGLICGFHRLYFIRGW